MASLVQQFVAHTPNEKKELVVKTLANNIKMAKGAKRETRIALKQI